jgi:hypothetical protein
MQGEIFVVGLRVGRKNAGDASNPFSFNLTFLFGYIFHYTGNVRTNYNYTTYSFILSETSSFDTVLKAY